MSSPLKFFALQQVTNLESNQVTNFSSLASHLAKNEELITQVSEGVANQLKPDIVSEVLDEVRAIDSAWEMFPDDDSSLVENLEVGTITKDENQVANQVSNQEVDLVLNLSSVSEEENEAPPKASLSEGTITPETETEAVTGDSERAKSKEIGEKREKALAPRRTFGERTAQNFTP